MTIAEITEKMDAIVKGAENRSLTDDEVTAYEKLEGELSAERKSEEVRKRNAAWQAPKITVVKAISKGGDEVLERAFDNYLRTGTRNADISDLEVRSSAQTEGTSSQGGYLVPPGYLVRIVERLKAFGGIAARAEEITTATGQPLQFPTNDDTGNSGEIVAEAGSTASGADVAFGTVTLGAYTYRASGADNEGIKASLELIQDSAFDVSAFVSRKVGTRIGRKQARDLAVGSGSGEPTGLFHPSTQDKALASGTTFTYAQLVDFVHKLDPAYREMSPVWIMSDGTAAALESLTDTAGRPLLTPYGTGVEGQIIARTLLGWPVQIDQSSPDGSDPEVGFVAFGDINEAYLVRRVAGVTVLADPYTNMSKGLMTWHAFARMDATIKNRYAYVLLSPQDAS